jgi:SAM-dependent methyltransferase
LETVSKEKKCAKDTCGFCACTDLQVLYRPEKAAKIHPEIFSIGSNARGLQTIVRCRGCGLVFASLTDLGQPPSEISQLLESADDSAYVGQEDERMVTFERCRRLVERHKPGRGKVLDVGAGNGVFLKVMARAGWDIAGVELNRNLCQHAASTFGIELKKGDLTELDFGQERYDAICFWDSLEHTLNPKEQMEKALDLLHASGIWVINYPAIDSIHARIFRANWWFFIPIHFFYFSSRYLAGFLRMRGCEILYQGRHFQTLRLGHVLAQAKPRFCRLVTLVENVLRPLGLLDRRLTYYAGQKIIIARKKGDEIR